MYEEYQSKLKNRIDDDRNQQQTVDMLQLVTFNIEKEVFGIDILNVQEIIRIVEITRVPNAKHFVKGVINLRGKIIPIIDLRKRLDMPTIEYNNHTRIIVVEINEIIVGFVVDQVNQVTRVEKSIIEPAPPNMTGLDNGYITGVAKLSTRLIILLDLQAILDLEFKGAN